MARADDQKTHFFDYNLYCDEPRFHDAVATVQSDLAAYLKGCHRLTATRQIRALLLNVMQLLQDKNSDEIAYSRSNNDTSSSKSLGNAALVTDKLFDVIDALAAEGLLEHAPSKPMPLLKGQKRLRSVFSPNDEFLSRYVTPYELLDVSPAYEADTPVIRYREAKDRDKAYSHYQRRRQQEEVKGKAVAALSRPLRTYNALLQQTAFSLPGHNPAHTKQTFTYRLYHDKGLTTGGRYYGGFWNNLKKAERAKLLINNEPTVELDYRNNHPHFVYALYTGDPMQKYLGVNGDAYRIQKLDNSGEYPRGLGKRLFLFSLNCVSDRGTRSALRKEFKRSETDSKLTSKSQQEASEWLKVISSNQEWPKLLQAFLELHRPIYGYLYNDGWKRLFWYDSEVCSYVLKAMTAKGIPVLSIHDSFICQKKYKAELEQAMTNAYAAIGLQMALPPIDVK